MPRFLAPAAAFALLLLPFSVLAQADPHVIPPGGVLAHCNFITGDFDYNCIPIYIGYLVQLVFSFIGTICLIQIIWGGYEIAYGGLEPFGVGSKEAGKKRISGAIAGFAFSVLAFVIVDMIVSALVS